MDIRLHKADEDAILALVRGGRIPHTVIIEGSSKEQRESAAALLTAGAICRADMPPCLCCKPCVKVLEHSHPDVITAQPSRNLKSGILSLKDLRENYLSQTSIKPNEADVKVFVFPEADVLLREDAQNALLKTIEEPPQNLLFLFTVESAEAMLSTVRSRAHLITLTSGDTPDEDSTIAAGRIADGIVSMYEYDLLLTLTELSDKDRLRAALTVLCEELRLALSFHSGVLTDDPVARKLARKLDRARTIALIEMTGEALSRLKTNVNIQLLLTWLSSQYRRITWQK